MAKHEVLVRNKDGLVLIKRDVFLERSDTRLITVDAPEGARIVRVEADGTVITDKGAVKNTATKKAVKKAPAKPKPETKSEQASDDDLGELLDGLDGK